jgi:hypothetical protein
MFFATALLAMIPMARPSLTPPTTMGCIAQAEQLTTNNRQLTTIIFFIMISPLFFA